MKKLSSAGSSRPTTTELSLAAAVAAVLAVSTAAEAAAAATPFVGIGRGSDRTHNNGAETHAIIGRRDHNTGDGWMSSLDGKVEFQPSSAVLSPLAESHWRRLTTYSDGTGSGSGSSGSGSLLYSNPYNTMFADGSETYYDEYAQAWRALGFYIDCDEDYSSSNNNQQQQQQQQQQQNRNSNNQGSSSSSSSSSSCRRYLLWAAYVDEQYTGHGPGEYMYYDRHNQLWDDTACVSLGNAQRCVKMDCHMPQSTHYTLLGYFKEPHYDTWIDTLVKYQGDCVWTDGEYVAMTNLSRTVWPHYCTSTIYTTKSDQVVYYDLRPVPYGGINIGLYVDNNCTQDYNGPLTTQEVLKGMVCGGYVDGGNDHNWNCGRSSTSTTTGTSSGSSSSYSSSSSTTHYNLQDHLQQWNAAFDAFKQCQPCRAYDLTSWGVAGKNYQSNVVKRHPDRRKYSADDRAYPTFMCNGNYASSSSSSSSSYGYGGGYGYNNGDDGGNDDNVEYDDASSSNSNNHNAPNYATLNQCMLFRTQTSMIPATWTDVEMAGTQGTITSVQFQPGSGAGSNGNSNSNSNSHGNTYRHHHSYGKGLNDRSHDNARWIAASLCLLMSAVVFCFSLYRYCFALEDYPGGGGMNDPLMVMVHNPTGVSA